MFLGLGSKKKGATVKVEFQIQVQEIKPWKAGTNTPLLVQWQRGDNRYGKTKSVVPKQEGDGGWKVVFNETFRLPAKLVREPEGKGRNAGIARFQKKPIVFTVHEATTDVYLARCVVDLADYGDLDSRVPASIPLAVGKKAAVSGGQQTPSLFFTIGPLEKKEERSFASRVSFGSSTPRSSISKAPEPKVDTKALTKGDTKVSSISGKSRSEPVLDDDTLKSIVAALQSDDENEDKLSIESFTDDESTPEDPTPRSDTTPKSSTTPRSEISKTSPMQPPRSEAPKTSTSTIPDTTPRSVSTSSSVSSSSSSPHNATTKPSTSIPETSLKSANTLSAISISRSSSTSPQPTIQSSTDARSASPYNPSHGRPTPTKHGPGKATASPATAAAMENSAERSQPSFPATKHGPGKESDNWTTSAEEKDNLRSSRGAVTSTPSITQLFSTDPVYNFNKDAESVASEKSVSRPSKDLPTSSGTSPEFGSQSSKLVKRPSSSPEQRDEASRAALFFTETTATSNSSSSSKVTKSSAATPLDTPSDVQNKLTPDKNGSSISASAENQTGREIARTDLLSKSPKTDAPPERELSQKPAGPLPLPLHPAAAAKAAAGAAASAYVAKKRTFLPTRRSSFDYSYESSEDSLSESSNGGRSPDHFPVLDQSRVSSRSVSSSEIPADAKLVEDIKEGGRKLDSKFAVRNDDEQDGSKTVGTKSPDFSKDVKPTSRKSPDLSKDVSSIGSKSPDRNKDVKVHVGGASPDLIKDAKSISSKSPDLNKGSKLIARDGSESPDVKKIIRAEPQREGEAAAVNPEEESVVEGPSVLGSARANLAKVEKRALEELRTKIANAEAKFLAESQKVEKLQGELRDVGAMEVSLYCVVAEHGNSSHKLHTPARRLARLYMHAYKHWSLERRAGTAKNSVSGLVTVAKSCGTDVSRLSFWWSNVVTLRTVFTQAFNTGLSVVSPAENAHPNPTVTVNGNGSTGGWARARNSVFRPSVARQASKQMLPSPKPPSTDWQDARTYIAALEKIEEWIYSKIVESLWWQAMIPRMQKNVDASTPTSPKGMSMLSPSALFGSEFANKAKEDLSKLAGDVSGIFIRKPGRPSISLPELGDARQGNMSVEIWKKAIMEALRRLCPVRGAGHDCGCLPMLIRMAIEGCVARLDVALFNAILREPDDDVPTDPLSDPVSDSSVLPISPGALTFGGGSQLKNVVVTWSTFITGLVNLKEPILVPDVEDGDDAEALDDSDKSPKFFNLIKATGDLLMLPKDILMDRAIRKEEARQEAEKIAAVFVMLRTTGDILQLPKDILMDRSVRREICPMLSVQLIRRILVNFVPDEFAPDPISPSLLAALNAEASIERQRQGAAYEISSSIPMAVAPPITYIAPSAYYVWSWIGETSANPALWGHSNNSLLRKGYTSDDDLNVMEQLQKSSASDKLEFLMGNSRQASVFTVNGNNPQDSSLERSQSVKEISGASRFELLEKVWRTS